jgi:hypothetical protein
MFFKKVIEAFFTGKIFPPKMELKVDLRMREFPHPL